MKIGNLKLKNEFLLAPMLEPNDIAFRILCKKAGASLCWTGMVSPLSKKNFVLDDRPAMQLFSSDGRDIERFMKKFDSKVSLWDFNLGCPSKLSSRLKHGVFMHKKIALIKEIFLKMRCSTKKPCCVKLRKSSESLRIARLAFDCDFDCIAIHPRTEKQGYSGKADYEFAKKFKKIDLPIIYSGDVDEKNASKILKDFDFLMVGRRAIGNPSVFSTLLEKKMQIDFFDYLKLAEAYGLSFRQIKYQAMNFSKSLSNAKKIRGEIVFAKSVDDLKKIYEKF